MSYFPEKALTPKEARALTYKPDPRYFEPKDLDEGATAAFRPCGTAASGHVCTGFEYYSEVDRRTLRSPDFPEDYESKAGLSYDAKKNGTKEKQTPKYAIYIVAQVRDRLGFCVVTITGKLQDSFMETMNHEAYAVAPNEMANFYFEVRKEGKGLDTKYYLTPVPKAPDAAARAEWAQARSGIYLPALFVGADPFAGKAAVPVEGLPPMRRDELGADQEPPDGAVPAGDDIPF